MNKHLDSHDSSDDEKDSSDDEKDSSDDEKDSEDESNHEDSYQADELCCCCDNRQADPYLRLEDGFYCTSCYESQKQWD